MNCPQCNSDKLQYSVNADHIYNLIDGEWVFAGHDFEDLQEQHFLCYECFARWTKKINPDGQ